MELKKGPLSFFQLIIGGLQTANRAFGSALALMGFVFCICIMMSLVMFFGTWIFHRYALLLQIPFSLCFGLLGLSAPLALIQILASRAEKTGLGVWDSLTSSVLPAIYLIVSSLLLAIPSLLLLGGAFLSHSKWVVAIVYVVLFFLLLPFVFLQHVLALRGEDPISALRYSWQLVTVHYFHTLFCIFGTGLLAFFCLLTFFFIIGMLTGGAWSNPAELQMQLLTMPKLYLLLGTVVFFALYWFVFLTIQSIMTLLFLNLDYCHRQVKTREHDTPLVQAAVGITDPVTLTKEVKVKSASIATSVTEHTISHLDKVYNSEEHLSQAVQQEEDRMPTLLFDEDMIKKIAEAERARQEQQEKEEDDDQDDPPSIKISNNSL